jgi:hypothetical protein
MDKELSRTIKKYLDYVSEQEPGLISDIYLVLMHQTDNDQIVI